MSLMQKLILPFSLLWQHKLKISMLLAVVLVFVFLLFPYDDLSDLVTSKVSQMTGNQVYLQFDSMSLSLIPAGFQLSNILVETSTLSGLKADEVVVRPNVMSLIMKKPGGEVSAKNLLGGDVNISMSPGNKTEDGDRLQAIDIKAERLSLSQIQNLAQLPVPLKGNLNLDSQAQVDLTFKVQPDISMTLNIDQFELPQASVNTVMGPLTLPELKLANVELVGRLSNGRFDITKGTLGKAGDELTGTLKGSLGVTLINNGGRIIPQFSNYDLVVDLNIKKTLEDRATLFLALLQPYKIAGPASSQYKFKVAGQNFINPPAITSP
jgi:type II secretion system protein N